ncbi:serine/threonine-protein phosphatase 4 regulatory subunit 2 [Panicum miliaceum]|uniref:Serine/threonine-protein phosphatase 4 regulatory subunit 2 n=1 Tax=Panicum miliaceum TaxID=4540 RepID=A0A3L6RZE5_PANMI|nr:serine/threonine-protein phosphatase 4 regulatory subunit 2 [Panicum miliaceum]
MEGAVTENAAAPVGAAAPEAAVHADQRGEGGAVVEDSAAPTVAIEATSDADQIVEDAVPEDGRHGETVTNVDVSPEEMRSITEVIAETGKFWHDWDFLKSLLSLQLKQAQMASQDDVQQQRSFSGETYSELVSRLSDALWRFEEGPPFTLQRLCEILLNPKGTYTKLPKLALALEKNLLVTSTIAKSTDPYPAAHGPPSSDCTQITENSGPVDEEPESTPEHTTAVPNGIEHLAGDSDEEMADAEAEEVSGSCDVEMQEDKPDQVEHVEMQKLNVSSEAVNASEPLSEPQS